MHIKTNWKLEEVKALFGKPFNDLLFTAHKVHRTYHDANKVQLSSLLNIKGGSCPEDCSYCSQSSRYNTGLKPKKLMQLDAVIEAAVSAKEKGADRFCMGAAWKNPNDKDLDRVIEMITAVKARGLEVCVTLGMLKAEQARKLKQSGLDYYNHNIDTSREHYGEIVSTHTFEERLQTLEHVKDAGINVCSGGILGLGEGEEDRASMLTTLANLDPHPMSVPINLLVPIPGTPLEHAERPTDIDLIKCIAVARTIMPRSVVRLSAGRSTLSGVVQAVCFFAGANSIFYGKDLLTTPNVSKEDDRSLFSMLGINRSDSNEEG